MNAEPTTQLALDLGHRPALGVDDFLVAPSNAEAVAWVDRWPSWDAPGLAIHGPAGCGKSHLSSVWHTRTQATMLSAADLGPGLDPTCLLGAADAAAVECGAAGEAADETTLLHLYNIVAERGGGLLLAAREPPARWQVCLADLASRLCALPAVGLQPPDDRLLAAVLIKQFGDRQLYVEEDVIAYLMARIERSFATARDLVQALDEAALAGHRRITIPLARDVLQR
jgi:chromosomal replication initiation ATPase DnaA